MRTIRDVLRLTFELKMSRRGVSEATGIGRTAVTITYFPDRILMQTRRINGVPGRDGACAVA